MIQIIKDAVGRLKTEANEEDCKIILNALSQIEDEEKIANELIRELSNEGEKAKKSGCSGCEQPWSECICPPR